MIESNLERERERKQERGEEIKWDRETEIVVGVENSERVLWVWRAESKKDKSAREREQQRKRARKRDRKKERETEDDREGGRNTEREREKRRERLSMRRRTRERGRERRADRQRTSLLGVECDANTWNWLCFRDSRTFGSILRDSARGGSTNIAWHLWYTHVTHICTSYIRAHTCIYVFMSKTWQTRWPHKHCSAPIWNDSCSDMSRFTQRVMSHTLVRCDARKRVWCYVWCYVYLCVFVHIYIYVYMYIYSDARKRVWCYVWCYLYLCVCVYIFIYIYIYIYSDARKRVWCCWWCYVYLCVCIYIYIWIYI